MVKFVNVANIIFILVALLGVWFPGWELATCYLLALPNIEPGTPAAIIGISLFGLVLLASSLYLLCFCPFVLVLVVKWKKFDLRSKILFLATPVVEALFYVVTVHSPIMSV